MRKFHAAVLSHTIFVLFTSLRWNRHLNAQLRQCLPFFEELRVRQQHVQLGNLPPLASFTQTSDLVAVPVTAALTSSANLRSLVQSTRVWDVATPGAEFGLAVHCCAYPGGVVAVWVFVASMAPTRHM
jgi:hypothetical protein